MKYSNGRTVMRRNNGRFKAATFNDVGIGVCKTCGHLSTWHYNGDPRTEFPHPNLWGYRCFHCTPMTNEEKAIQAEIDAKTPPKKTMADLINHMVKRVAEIDEAEK